MGTYKAQIELLRHVGMSIDESTSGVARLAWPPPLRHRQGTTLDDLHARKPWGPEQVHPKRLLEEMAEEFGK